MKVILIDIDGTLNNFDEYFISEFKRLHHELVNENTNPKNHVDVLNIDRAKGLELLRSNGFTEGMKPLKGSVEAVHAISERGHQIFFCTSLVTDFSNTLRDRVQWIGKWFGPEWKKRVIFTHDKTMIRGDFLIDDSPSKSKGLYEPTWKYIVFDSSHNENYENEFRIYDWENMDAIFSIIDND